LTACGGENSEIDVVSQDVAISEHTESSREMAFDFPFAVYTGKKTLGGMFINLSDLQGKPVVLNFWAGLCPPCTAEMPELQEFYDEYSDKVVLLGIDVGRYTGLGERTDAADLLDDLNITYPTGFDRDGNTIKMYEVFNMPTTFFLNSKGEIYRKWTGVINKKSLIEVSDEMIADEGDSA
jgi:thiol-disulfide isomerase/thioredoxin